MDNIDYEIAKMGFEHAKDLAQQLITLSTAILTLSVTFLKEFTKDAAARELALIKSAWVTFLVSICGGIWTLMALTGTLMPQQSATQEDRLKFGSNLLPAKIQIISFIFGIILIIIYGGRSLSAKSNKGGNNKPAHIGKVGRRK